MNNIMQGEVGSSIKIIPVALIPKGDGVYLHVDNFIH